ncbi:MAG TPA: radical SAM protein [Candidatus Angelobacter sp.]|jgi:DNA repair photolyase|nr:radical SAM protein [Candidatus Angelobacter sp.]
MSSSLFPQIAPGERLVGIARLAAEGEAVEEGHNVDYITLENRSVLTRCNSPRMPFPWMINPYRGCEFACKYCYARYTHEFMEMREGLDFERKIFVKQHTAWLLRQELKKVRPGESIAIGTATDPYQPAERRFGVTRALLDEFALHSGLEIGLVTKSRLILRDVPVLKKISENNKLSICVTVTTLKTDLARMLEPRAPRPDLRLDAVQRLVKAGIRAGVNCAPVLPGITDSPSDLENLIKASARAGAAFVYTNPLFLKPCAEKVFMPFLEEKFPHLVTMYRERYASRAFLPPEYGERISTLIKKYCQKYGLNAGEYRKAASGDSTHVSEQLGLFSA